VDNTDEYVIFETATVNRKYAVMYGIDHQYVGQADAYSPHDNKLSFLTSNQLNNFYQLTLNPKTYGGVMTIMRWHFIVSNPNDTIKVRGSIVAITRFNS